MLRSLPAAALALPLLSAALGAQATADVDALLRPAIRIAGARDTAYSLPERMRYYHVPGVSLAVIENGKVVFARGYGVTEFGGSTPVDTTTLFLAGSISKPVFATAALKLVEEGKLSLDTDINASLKSWQLPQSRFTDSAKVTLRRLLTHTAGLTVWGFPGYDADSVVPTVAQVLNGVRPANTPAVRNDTFPGSLWRYSGGGYTIAQLMAQDVTGEPFPALMRRLVLAPAGMNRSTYENPLPASRHREAASGHEQLDVPVHGRFHIYPEMAAAGLWTTAPDLARWAIAVSRSYNGDESSVLKPATAREMVSKIASQKAPFGNGFWGLGVEVRGEGDSISFSHGGRDEGFVAQAIMYPKLGRGLVILTNGISGALLAEVQRAFAERYGISAPPRPERTVVSLDSAALVPLVGEYVFTQPTPLVIDVKWADGALELYDPTFKRRMRLHPESATTFFDRNTGQRFVFEREGGNPGGKGLTIAIGQGQARRVGTRR